MKSNPRKIFTKPYKRKIIFSLTSAFILIVANYFVNNASLFTGESICQYYYTQIICNWFGLHHSVNYGDAIYFNISYDKQLVPVYKGDYENKVQIGNNIITDRFKLYSFLKLLKKTDKYKYVIIDLTFDDVNEITCYDDSLFNLIGEMRDVVFTKIEDIPVSRKNLETKQARAIYYTTPLETNFVRYQYSFDNEQTLASHVFSAHDSNKRIKRYGFPPFYLYFSNGKLCHNSLFLTFDNHFIGEDPKRQKINETFFSEIEIHNLGDYLSAKDDSVFAETFIMDMTSDTEGRYVVICNTRTDDIHDTYVGYRPGAQIVMRALTSLEESKHYVSYISELFWYIVFFLISLNLTNIPELKLAEMPQFKNKFWDILSRSKQFLSCRSLFKTKFWNFILSFISYSSILLFFSICEYVLFDKATSLILPELYFTILNLYQKFQQTKAL